MSSAEDGGQRHSRADEAELIRDPQLKAEAEALNGLRQYDLAMRMVQDAIDRKRFRLRLSQVLALHREALSGISSFAGNFRPAGVAIEGSKHEPVGAHLVPELVEDLCDYVNDHWQEATPLHLAGLCDVATQLDPSVCRRQRPNLSNPELFGSLRET